MWVDELGDDAPGQLVTYGRRSYYKPDPLPPSRGLSLDDDFYEMLSEATFWLGQLSGISRMVDFPAVLYTSLLRKEAMESAEIEGADIDFNALYSYETQAVDADSTPDSWSSSTDTTKDIYEVLNYERALEHGIDTLDSEEELSIDLLHRLHEQLLTGVPDDRVDTDTIGAFKTTPNHIGDYLPPVPDAVDGAMEALLTYYRTGGRYHPLTDIALFHYQFETIHPYGDGNGRLGRLLVTLQLHDNGYLERPTLYLSEYFNRNKQTYIDRMVQVRKTGDWESWLSFFITGVRHQAEESVIRTVGLDSLRQQYETEYGDSAYTADQLACWLFEQPYVTARMVAEQFNVEHSTAYRAIETLQEQGVLEEVTGQQRNREFRATEIFEILERPPETY
ncbi:Fic family protein [Haloarcula sp. Atlit-7R]|uniref:Fic family protein n=1 Tax=Haloarcula sp. Atlit-7R TaxID=2282125 RepID=UPI000EF1529D|nr:Fic family protein [Haloarcula sp. Atlit-7R]RLM89131.1 Fic family protein [Haloarcula sp. Atlit-7R]